MISSSKHPCLRGELFQRSKFWEHIFIDSHFQSLSPSVRLKKGRFRECPPRKKSQQHAVHSKLGFKDVCLASLRSTLSLGPLVHCLLWIELIYPKLLGSPQMTFNFTSVMYERIHSVFLLGFSVLSLSIMQGEKTSPGKAE